MWKLDYKESWVPKNWCFIGEDSWESLGLQRDLTSPSWRMSWVFTGRTDVEAETPILWPPDVKSWLIRKDPDAGKDWGQEEKGMTEDEMVGWHHWLDGHEFAHTLGVGDGQGGVECCSPWGHKESDGLSHWTEMTEVFHIHSVWRRKWQTAPFKWENESKIFNTGT